MTASVKNLAGWVVAAFVAATVALLLVMGTGTPAQAADGGERGATHATAGPADMAVPLAGGTALALVIAGGTLMVLNRPRAV